MAWPIIAAAVGTGINVWGQITAANAAQDAADDYAEQMEEQWEWNWEETKRREAYAQYLVDIANVNNETAANLQDQMALDSYNQALYIRDYDYQNEVNAFNESEQQFAQQVDYNAIAATLARDEQSLWLDEQIQQIGFDSESLILDTDKKLQELGFKSEEIALDTEKKLQELGFKSEGLALDTEKKLQELGFDYSQAANQLGEQRDLFASQRQGLNLKQQQARAKTSFDQQQNRIKGMQDEGKVRAMGQAGRTARKNRQAAVANAGLAQAALVDSITRADSMFNLERQRNTEQYGYKRLGAEVKLGRIGNLAEFTQSTAELGQRGIAASTASVQSTAELGQRGIAASTASAQLTAELGQRGIAASTASVQSTAELGQRGIAASMTSAQAKNQANLLRIEHDQYGADMSAEGGRLSPPPAYADLPPIPAPYYTPEVIIPDAYVTENKPPMPPNAPNMTAGVALQAAGSAISSISGAAASYNAQINNRGGSGGGQQSAANAAGWPGNQNY